MAGNPRFFGRKYKLTLDTPEGGSKVFEVEDGKPAMDIKFDVTYARGQVAREGTISILGLGYSTMQEYLSLAAMTRGLAMSHLVHVSLEAGYFTDAGMLRILDGFVWHASVTSPPNMWLTLKVSEFHPLGGRAVQLGDISNMKIRPAVQSVMDKFSDVEGVDFEVEDETEDQILDSGKKMVSLPFGGKNYSIGDAIRFLNSNVSDDVYFILLTRDDERDTRTLIAVDKGTEKATEGDIEINGDTGLLSVTGIDAVNGCITTFIDGAVDDTFSHLNLTSILNPQANGRYYICKKQYVGHYMGQEWYTRYFCSAREGDSEQEDENRRIEA